MASSLAGNVALIGCGPTNLVVRFFTPGTQVEIMKAASVTNAAGNFTVLGVTAGIYDVGVKSQHSLSILSPNEVFVDGVPTNVNFGNLNRGDLDANDICNMLDSGILAATRALPQFWGTALATLVIGCYLVILPPLDAEELQEKEHLISLLVVNLYRVKCRHTSPVKRMTQTVMYSMLA